ncbi:hypothetical protein V5N11_022859 [Cardamine amara subsp. amara]|uniref:Uncharacterized protein n=1 Tax=Cardamine amara subsp. amara TaxID=228776 RepID=A0ABD1BM93_CARAN
MKFVVNRLKVVLHGLHQGSVREVKALKLKKIQEEQAQLAMICVQDIHHEEDMVICSLNANQQESVVHQEIEEVLNGFSEVFAEPTSLPPFRENHNHKIPLKEGSDPVNQRPYHYAIYQKNEIDQIVEEMLTNGII